MLSNRSAAQYWGDFCKEALMAAIYSDLEGKSVFSLCRLPRIRGGGRVHQSAIRRGGRMGMTQAQPD
jgi:hypothetical protein